MRIEDATEELREKLQKATQLRMLRSDVPVGSYLSGGLDSSVIARMGREAKEGEFRTFSIRFEDDEFDETSFQRKMASTLDSQHAEYVVTKKEIAEVFPDVVYHAERPILRTAPAPLFMLSKLVRESGYKVVITGEGADEMLAGYDLFREAKIREFMARNPDSAMRQKLSSGSIRTLPAPTTAKGMSINSEARPRPRRQPGFSHAPRWTTTSSLKRFFNASLQEELTTSPGHDVLEEIPANFSTWDTLGQAQFLEVTTLLSSYLISSQGDRMLMGHSVEGRFPFLDVEVMEFCNALPAQYKLIGLNEKNILKRLAKGKIPQEIIDRKKQPYRAPDAICFAVKDAPAYVAEMFSENALSRAGIFDVRSAIGLYEKCRARAAGGASDGTFSNTDNMGFIGILSLQLLADQFIRQGVAYAGDDIQFTTFVDRVTVLSH
jgi:asparagine synthase (glutamine-hydrolysing)